MGISMQNIDDILYSYLILRVYAYTNILHENIKKQFNENRKSLSFRN